VIGQVAMASALVITGGVVGVISQRLRYARKRAKGSFTCGPAAAPGASLSSGRLTISLLPDPFGETAGPLTSASRLAILLEPDRPDEPRKLTSRYPGQADLPALGPPLCLA
jgi:hypothetical protein